MKIKIPYYSVRVIIILIYTIYACVNTVRISFDRRGSYLILGIIIPFLVYEYAKYQINRSYTLVFSIVILWISILYQILPEIKNTPFPFLSYIILLSLTFFPLAIYKSLMCKAYIREQKTVFVLMTFVLFYVYLNTLINIEANQDIVHYMTKQNYLTDTGNIENVITIDQSYATIAIILLLLYYMEKSKQLWRKLVCAGIVVFLINVVLAAQYTSILFIVLICVIIKYSVLGRISVKTLFATLFFVVLLFFLPNILIWLASVVQSENMTDRLNEVAILLKYGDASGYNLSSRLELYKEGILCFLQSPIWGNESIPINPHSTFIQLAADLGIMGLIPFIYILNMTRKRIKQTFSKEEYRAYFPIYCSFIITGMINPIVNLPVTSLVVFCYVPLGIQLLSRREENEKLEY